MFDRLTKLVISLLFHVVNTIFHLIYILFGIRSSDTLVVVSYHSVKPWQRERFADQMDQVVKAGKPVFADVGISSNKGIHHLAVTFDDGYKNFMDNALPVLLARKIPVTIFIPSGYIGKYAGWIKNPHHKDAREILMSADELKRLPNDMVKIGSHSVTHSRLTSLHKEQIISELSESKKQLELMLKRNITTLSFPYDDYNDEIVGYAREAGYLRVFKDLPTYPISKTDGFLLGRISASPEDWAIEYRLKLKGAYQWLPFAVNIKQYFKTR